MKPLRLILLFFFVLLLLGWFGIPLLFKMSLPPSSGVIKLKGLSDTTTVYYNSKGFPQIFALNESDLYFVLGWHHAANRLFQMELIRKISQGRLKEFLTKAPLSLDMQNRQLGFFQKATSEVSKLDDSTTTFLNAYCSGINSFIQSTPLLPPEFILLNTQPQLWSKEDVLAIGLYQSWYSHALMDHDRDFQHLISLAGKEAENILLQFKYFSPTTIPGYMSPPYSLPGLGTASNSWVVAPKLSSSGAALHASDPHLIINMFPGFWYGAGLHCPQFDFVGITAPGLPMAIMGHTGKIAYAFTVASVDVVDYYNFPRGPNNLFMGPNSLFKPDTVFENFFLSPDSIFKAEFLKTPYGPVIESDSTHLIVQHWSGFDFSAAQFMNAVFQLPKCKNFSEFRETVRKFSALDANWTFSDHAGNIGYQLGISVPLRHQVHSFQLMDGTNPSNFWTGYRTQPNTPALYNPLQGFIATCNNQIIGPANGDTIPGFYDPYRIIRAYEFLEKKQPFDLNYFRDMQMDFHSARALHWKHLFKRAASLSKEFILAKQIEKWNGAICQNSHIAALFELWWYYLGRDLFADEAIDNWKSFYAFQDEILLDSISAIIDDKSTPNLTESLDQVSIHAFKNALHTAGGKRWSELSSFKIKHLFSDVTVLDKWLHLSRDIGSLNGDPGSLHANWFDFNEKNSRFESIVGPSMRFLLDWSETDHFQLCLFPGQSGNPLSPHYSDLIDDWKKGIFQTIPNSKSVIQKLCTDRLLFIPEQ